MVKLLEYRNSATDVASSISRPKKANGYIGGLIFSTDADAESKARTSKSSFCGLSFKTNSASMF